MGKEELPVKQVSGKDILSQAVRGRVVGRKGPTVSSRADSNIVDEGVHAFVSGELDPRVKKFSEKNNGKEVIDLSTGAPGEPPLTCMLDKGVKVYQKRLKKHFGYQHSKGPIEAREEWTESLNRGDIFARPIGFEQVMISGPGKAFLNAVGNALRNDDRINVAVATPGYGGHHSAALKTTEGNRNGDITAIPIDVMSGRPANNTYEILESTCSKVIFMSTPQNPLGKAVEKEAAGDIIQYVEDHPDVVMVADAVYNSHIYGHRGKYTSFADIPEIQNQTIVLVSTSKGPAAPGFRVSAGIVPDAMPELREAINRQLADALSCGPTPETEITMASFTSQGEREILERVRLYEEKIDVFQKTAKKVGLNTTGISGAWYTPIAVPEGITSTDFSKNLAVNYGVKTIPFEFFGGFVDAEGKPKIIDIYTKKPILPAEISDKYIRLALVPSKKDIIEGVGRIGEAMKQNYNKDSKY